MCHRCRPLGREPGWIVSRKMLADHGHRRLGCLHVESHEGDTANTPSFESTPQDRRARAERVTDDVGDALHGVKTLAGDACWDKRPRAMEKLTPRR
jgi:hypothetical protein